MASSCGISLKLWNTDFGRPLSSIARYACDSLEKGDGLRMNLAITIVAIVFKSGTLAVQVQALLFALIE
jgi:hypothetical protein